MTFSEEINRILRRIEEGQQTAEDINYLHQRLIAGARQVTLQVGTIDLPPTHKKYYHFQGTPIIQLDGKNLGTFSPESPKLPPGTTFAALVVIDSCHAVGMATSKGEDAAKADAELLKEFEDFQRTAPSKGMIDALKQGKGRDVFTSSEGKQKSWIKDTSISIYTYHFLEALQGAANRPGDTEVKVSNLMNYLSKAVPESARQLHGAEQTLHFDFDTGDFAIALLRGGKGLPDKGWNEVKPEATQKIYKIADNITQHGKYITNINKTKNLHIGDVYND